MKRVLGSREMKYFSMFFPAAVSVYYYRFSGVADFINSFRPPKAQSPSSPGIELWSDKSLIGASSSGSGGGEKHLLIAGEER